MPAVSASSLSLILVVLLACFAEDVRASAPDFVVHSSGATGGFTQGLHSKDWLYGLQINLAVLEDLGPLASALEISGGNCSYTRINHIQASDLTVIPGTPAFGLSITGLSIKCNVLVRGKALDVSFDAHDGNVDLHFSIQPIVSPGSQLWLPLGAVTVTKCAVSGKLGKLEFSGSSIFAGLEQLHETIRNFINKELPIVACMQLRRFLEKKASAALEQVFLQLKPLLEATARPVAPQPEPLAWVQVVDWTAYPPAKLLQTLVASRPDVVADLMSRVPQLKLPLQRVHVNRTVTVEAEGTVLNAFLEAMRVQGVNTFEPASLVIRGRRHVLDLAAAFQNLTVVATLQLQVQSLDAAAGTQALPLWERFDLALSLSDLQAEAETLALISQQSLDDLQVDQYQQMECLVSCARDVVPRPSAPVALQKLHLLNMTPALTMAARGSLEAGLADVVVTVLSVMTRDYGPATRSLVQASVGFMNETTNAFIQQFLESTPPCGQTNVYFGPGDLVNNMLLASSALVAVLGIGLGLMSNNSNYSSNSNSNNNNNNSNYNSNHNISNDNNNYHNSNDNNNSNNNSNNNVWSHPDAGYNSNNDNRNNNSNYNSNNNNYDTNTNLASDPVVPPILSVAYPYLVVSTMILFVFADLGLGTVINVIFTADGRSTTIGPAFSFSVLTLSRDSVRGGAFMLTILIAGLSGLWPFAKLGLLVFAWRAPAKRLAIGSRSRLLVFLDEYGKYSLIDSWLAVLALCSYDLSWARHGTSIVVHPVPMLPFFMFVIATVLSLVLGHVATEFHHRALLRALSVDERPAAADLGGAPVGGKLSRHRLCEDLPEASARFSVILLALAFAAILVGACITTLQMHVSGALADLLLSEDARILPYSLVGIGAFLTRGPEDPPLGLRAVQAIFFTFALVIPLLLLSFLLCLLLVPLPRSRQRALLKLCRILDAWAAFDVFVIGVAVANFEFGLLANFLVYNDNIGYACSWVRDNLAIECLAIECHATPGFALLAVAGLASCFLPGKVCALCQEALAQQGGDTEEDLLSSDSEGSDEAEGLVASLFR